MWCRRRIGCPRQHYDNLQQIFGLGPLERSLSTCPPLLFDLWHDDDGLPLARSWTAG
jgi:hypothetical protein